MPAQVGDKRTIGVSAPVRSEASGSNSFGEERRRSAVSRELCLPSPSPISPVVDYSCEQGALVQAMPECDGSWGLLLRAGSSELQSTPSIA